MNRVKSFEEMGREADRATRDAALALNWVQGLGSEEQAQALITVAIKGANWDDGTLRLQEKMTQILRERLGSDLQRAVHELIEDGRKAREGLIETMQNPPVPDLSRQVPRMTGGELSLGDAVASIRQQLPEQTPAEALAEQQAEPPVPGEVAADTYAAAFTAMGPQARELLSWCAANPAARFARTPARDALVAGGYLRQNGSGANSTWDLTDSGQALAAFA